MVSFQFFRSVQSMEILICDLFGFNKRSGHLESRANSFYVGNKGMKMNEMLIDNNAHKLYKLKHFISTIIVIEI